MARIQKIESDSSFNLSKVPTGQILVYTVYQNGQIFHRARLSDGSTVNVGVSKEQEQNVAHKDIMPLASEELSGSVVVFTGPTAVYAKGHTYQCIYNGGSYTWLDITPTTIQQDTSYVTFTEQQVSHLQDKKTITFNYGFPPEGLIANTGAYYPIQKSTVTVDLSEKTVTVALNAYLAYANQSQLQGTWLCFFAGGDTSNSWGGGAAVSFDNYYNKSQTDSKIQQGLQGRIPWPTNAKTRGYVLKAVSDSYGVMWAPDAAAALTSDYFTKGQVISNTSSAISSALAKYYTSSQVEQKLSDKLDVPQSATSTGYVLMKTDQGTSWGPVATGDSFSSAYYYTKNDVDQSLAQKITNPTGGTSGQVLTKTTGGVIWTSIEGDRFYSSDYYDTTSINTLLANKIDVPPSFISSGYVLMKTSQGTSWGPAATGDDFTAENYYSNSTVDQLLSSKIDMPDSTVAVGWSIKKAADGGVQWAKTSYDQSWTALTANSTIVLSTSDGARQKLTMTQDVNITAPTLSSDYTELTLQLQKNGVNTPVYTCTLDNMTIQVGETILIGWYWDGSQTKRLPIMGLGDIPFTATAGDGTTVQFNPNAYYNKETVDQKLSGKLNIPQSATSTGYVLMKTSQGTSWGPVVTDLSDYYSNSTVDQMLSGKLDVPSGGTSGQFLMKTSEGVSWETISAGEGGTSGDTFVAANYYTKQYIDSNYYNMSNIDAMSSTLNNSITKKLAAPTGPATTGDVLVKTGTGTAWRHLIVSGSTEPQDPFNGMIWIQ